MKKKKLKKYEKKLSYLFPGAGSKLISYNTKKIGHTAQIQTLFHLLFFKIIIWFEFKLNEL